MRNTSRSIGQRRSDEDHPRLQDRTGSQRQATDRPSAARRHGSFRLQLGPGTEDRSQEERREESIGDGAAPGAERPQADRVPLDVRVLQVCPAGGTQGPRQGVRQLLQELQAEEEGQEGFPPLQVQAERHRLLQVDRIDPRQRDPCLPAEDRCGEVEGTQLPSDLGCEGSVGEHLGAGRAMVRQSAGGDREPRSSLAEGRGTPHHRARPRDQDAGGLFGRDGVREPEGVGSQPQEAAKAEQVPPSQGEGEQQPEEGCQAGGEAALEDLQHQVGHAPQDHDGVDEGQVGNRDRGPECQGDDGQPPPVEGDLGLGSV